MAQYGQFQQIIHAQCSREHHAHQTETNTAAYVKSRKKQDLPRIPKMFQKDATITAVNLFTENFTKVH